MPSGAAEPATADIRHIASKHVMSMILSMTKDGSKTKW